MKRGKIMKRKILVCTVTCLVFLLSLTACGNNALSSYIDSAVNVADDYLHGKLDADEATDKLDTIQTALDSMSDTDNDASLASLIVMRLSSQINIHHRSERQGDSSSAKQDLRDISDTREDLVDLK